MLRRSHPGSLSHAALAERQRVLELLRRFGWNSTSFQVLEPEFHYWFCDADACVAYVDTGRAWVAAGAPIAPEARLAHVALEFVRAARAARRRALFFATEHRFAQLPQFDALLIGEQPAWNPSAWQAGLSRSRSLREQLRRARAKGVSIRRVEPHELAASGSLARADIERVIARWLDSRVMAPMGFLVSVQPFDFVEERRIFIARSPSGVYGFMGLVPVYARNGWLLEDLVRAPGAPNGMTELMVDHAMRQTSEEGADYVTLGLAPLSGSVDAWLRIARRLGAGLFDFAGLRRFKAKLLPHDWAPVYLSVPRGANAQLAIYDSLVAFSRGGLLSFGFATLLRGPAVIVRLLSYLLVPWTIGLSALDAERFFPTPSIKWSWVGFDIALCAALMTLTLRFRPRLARALSAIIAADALVTALQAVWFNWPRARSLLEVIGVAIAVAAPALAAVVLRNASRRAPHPRAH